jgi:prepilin-type N-terminal cleavage/methylation domain-containing protein
MTRMGHTLIECITVVLILSILALIAVPRLNLGAVRGVQTEAAVRELATDLRRARMQAIAEAAGNPTGFALVMSGASPYGGYRIVDLHDSAVVASRELPADVRCSGGQRFEFGPLGNLNEGSDTQVRVYSEDRAYQLQIVPATGTVKWFREE